jgi:putative addiction module component (TIGR02574 family)
MTKAAADLLEQALQLSNEEREDLAARLMGSLDGDLIATDEEWAAELKERLDELKDGRVKPIPWAEVRQQIMDDIDDTGRS